MTIHFEQLTKTQDHIAAVRKVINDIEPYMAADNIVIDTDQLNILLACAISWCSVIEELYEIARKKRH